MNTMPQIFDDRPLQQGGFAVSRSAPQPQRQEPKQTPKLTLVVDHPQAAQDSLAAPLVATRPYGLNGRRHLASVPARQPAAAAAAQAHRSQADNTGMAFPWPRQRLEPLAFALVLLVSVAALAVATRVG